MTQARIQPFRSAYNFNIGYYSGQDFFSRIVTDRNKALFLYINRFCLMGKSKGANFNEAVEEVKSKIKIFDNQIKNDNINGCFEKIYKPKKVEDHLLNFFALDIETHNVKNDASPFCICV